MLVKRHSQGGRVFIAVQPIISEHFLFPEQLSDGLQHIFRTGTLSLNRESQTKTGLTERLGSRGGA